MIKVVGDVVSEKVRNELVEKCVSNFGKITTLVNNAALFRLSTIENTRIDEYDEIMNVNLRSVLQLTQLCVSQLKINQGSIVNVSSIAGTKSFPNLLPYSMSKAGLDQFTKCVALELAIHNVRVNSVK